MIFLWVPETKQRTLEELDHICEASNPQPTVRRQADNLGTVGVPTTKHMMYQVQKVIPYAFQRYILWKDVDLEPLYKFHST